MWWYYLRAWIIIPMLPQIIACLKLIKLTEAFICAFILASIIGRIVGWCSSADKDKPKKEAEQPNAELVQNEM